MWCESKVNGEISDARFFGDVDVEGELDRVWNILEINIYHRRVRRSTGSDGGGKIAVSIPSDIVDTLETSASEGVSEAGRLKLTYEYE